MSCSREIEVVRSLMDTVKASLSQNQFSDALVSTSSAKQAIGQLEECIDRQGAKDMGVMP